MKRMVPPCRSVTQRAMARPSPVPPPPSTPRVPNRSNARSRSPGATPGPWSETSSSQRSSVALGADGDGAAGRTVPRCVVEQVGDELVEPGGIALDGEIGRIDADVVRHVAAGDAGLADRGVEQPSYVDPLAGQRCLAGVDPGEVEQVADQTGHPLALVERGAEGHRVGLGDAVGEVLEEGVEGGERGAQLVADVGDQLAALAVDGGELLGHPVERVGELADLVPRRRRDPDVVVTRRHPAGGDRHLAQRRGHADREQLGDRERERDGHRDAEPDRHSPGLADRRDDHGDDDAGDDQQAELDLDRADRVEEAHGSDFRPASRA